VHGKKRRLGVRVRKNYFQTICEVTKVDKQPLKPSLTLSKKSTRFFYQNIGDCALNLNASAICARERFINLSLKFSTFNRKIV
jgi:hypothetical protein